MSFTYDLDDTNKFSMQNCLSFWIKCFVINIKIYLTSLCLVLIICRGFPVWLRDIPGIEFRTDNTPFKVL